MERRLGGRAADVVANREGAMRQKPKRREATPMRMPACCPDSTTARRSGRIGADDGDHPRPNPHPPGSARAPAPWTIGSIMLAHGCFHKAAINIL
jgi:hypothetical protein